jgi:hypothetical protein
MTNQIPGVPEGWIIERIGKPIFNVDHVIHYDGQPMLCDYDSSYLNRVIIRKIEKPAKYRPFENAREADQFWNASLRLAGVAGDAKDSRFRITSIGRDGITTNAEFYSYNAAFYKFYVDDDGTPFGVKIDE